MDTNTIASGFSCSDCGCDHHHSGENKKRQWIFLIFGLIFLAAALFYSGSSWVVLMLFLTSYLIIGGDVVFRAIKNIGQGRIFDENFLMTIATFGAFLIGEYPEAVAVMLFYKVGEAFQDRAIDQSKKSIEALLDIKPDYATVIIEGKEYNTDPSLVEIGSDIIVKPGEKIPIDGIIIKGYSFLDTSALTGESKLRDVEPGDSALSGSINTSGLLTIQTTKSFGDSTVSKIIDLVQNASQKKAPTEKFITKFARYYTPVVVALAAMLAFIPPLVISGASFEEWIYRALVFLVISCPCALVISIPLGFFGGIGAASKNGILIKGGNFLEALPYADTVIFDKTGTLTKGEFAVTALIPEKGFTESEIIKYAAIAEKYSGHPIAKAITSHYGQTLDEFEITNYQEIAGHGIKAETNGEIIHLGNRKIMEVEHLEFACKDIVCDHRSDVPIYLWINRQYAGKILLSDMIRDDAKETVEELKKYGVNEVMMLSGDIKETAEKVSEQLGITSFFSQLLPEDKLQKLEEVLAGKSKNQKVIFVGDGINDAPVLARADIGVAMGGIGSDAAIEAADIVLMRDTPGSLVTGIRIARKTKTIIWQNIILALGVKGVIMILGALGIAGMWEAIFADVGVALIAILNAVRVLSFTE